MSMGERLKELRCAANMTQQELADKVGVSRSTIKAIETGINHPRHSLLIKLCNEFNVNSDYMLGNAEEKGTASEIDNFTSALIQMLIEKGRIKDPDKIPPDVADMILSSIKDDIRRALKERNNRG